jgi:hypothetical protein
MANTTTVTAAQLAYYFPPMDGDTFGAGTHPTSTAIDDYITRSQNHINELGPNITQNMHDEAVLEIMQEYMRLYNQHYLNAGADSAGGGGKGGAYNFSPRALLSKETRQEIYDSEHKVKRRVSIGKLISGY